MANGKWRINSNEQWNNGVLEMRTWIIYSQHSSFLRLHKRVGSIALERSGERIRKRKRKRKSKRGKQIDISCILVVGAAVGTQYDALDACTRPENALRCYTRYSSGSSTYTLERRESLPLLPEGYRWRTCRAGVPPSHPSLLSLLLRAHMAASRNPESERTRSKRGLAYGISAEANSINNILSTLYWGFNEALLTYRPSDDERITILWMTLITCRRIAK
jgi:hypothetical protein